MAILKEELLWGESRWYSRVAIIWSLGIPDLPNMSIKRPSFEWISMFLSLSVTIVTITLTTLIPNYTKALKYNFQKTFQPRVLCHYNQAFELRNLRDFDFQLSVSVCSGKGLHTPTNSQKKYSAQKWYAHISQISSFRSPFVI